MSVHVPLLWHGFNVEHNVASTSHFGPLEEKKKMLRFQYSSTHATDRRVKSDDSRGGVKFTWIRSHSRTCIHSFWATSGSLNSFYNGCTSTRRHGR